MSIVVDLADLARALPRHPTAYLLLGGGERPHVGEVEVRVAGAELVIPQAGRTARRVLPQHPDVTLLCPPADVEGYALVVDGHASLVDDQIHLRPTHAVLHRRPRPDSPPSATGCEGDCQPVTGGS